jgi:hypothetical protein
MVNVAGVAALPLASCALQVTVVVPSGKVEPEGGAQERIGLGSMVSVAVAVYVTVAPAELVAEAVMLDGTVIVGGVVSVTVTVKVAGVAAFPLASCASQVTVVTPTGKVEPEGGEHDRVGFGSIASVADAV